MSSRVAAFWVMGLAAAGLAAAVYLAVAHYTSPTVLACGSSGIVNCEKVTTSQQSSFIGIPVAVLGVAWFAGMLVISLPRLWNRPALRWARLIGAAAGTAFVLWLIYAEIAVIGSICLWCTVVHACALGISFVIVFEASRAPQP